MTTYLVLRRADVSGEGDFAWAVDAEVDADTARQAIKRALNNGSVEDSEAYVAIPKRSWNPVKVTVESTPRVKLTDA